MDRRDGDGRACSSDLCDPAERIPVRHRAATFENIGRRGTLDKNPRGSVHGRGAHKPQSLDPTDVLRGGLWGSSGGLGFCKCRAVLHGGEIAPWLQAPWRTMSRTLGFLGLRHQAFSTANGRCLPGPHWSST